MFHALLLFWLWEFYIWRESDVIDLHYGRMMNYTIHWLKRRWRCRINSRKAGKCINNECDGTPCTILLNHAWKLWIDIRCTSWWISVNWKYTFTWTWVSGYWKCYRSGFHDHDCGHGIITKDFHVDDSHFRDVENSKNTVQVVLVLVYTCVHQNDKSTQNQ